MTQALHFILSVILWLFGVIMVAIAAVEGFLRNLMAQAGVRGDLQKPALIVVAVLLILLAMRLFGRLFGVLIVIFLILLLVHILVPGLGAPGSHMPQSYAQAGSASSSG